MQASLANMSVRFELTLCLMLLATIATTVFPARAQDRAFLPAEVEALERQVAEGEARFRPGTTPNPEAEMKLLLAMARLSTLYVQADRTPESWPLSERMLARLERLFGPNHPNIVAQLEATAAALALQGRLPEAEKLRRRAIAINERAFGKESLQVAVSLQGLAHLMRMQERYEDGLEFALRARDISEFKLAPSDPQGVIFSTQVADLYMSLRRYAEAEPILRHALATLEKRGSRNVVETTLTIQTLQSLSLCYFSQDRYKEAQPLIDRAVELSSRTFGPDHVLTAAMLSTLALQLTDRDQFDAAQALYMRVVPMAEKNNRLGLMLSDTYNGLGLLAFKKRAWRQAHDWLRRGSEIAITHERATSGTPTRRDANYRSPQADVYLLQAVAAFRAAEEGGADADTLRDEAFQIAQRAERSLVAGAISQMAARIAQGSSPAAGLLRERQDLARIWQRLDKQLESALTAPSTQQQNPVENDLRAQLASLNGRLDDIDARLEREFPDIAKLVDPAPVSIKDVQKLLNDDDALVFIVQRPSQTLVWVIRRDAVHWHLAPLGEAELASSVSSLRCGLDETAWSGNGAELCKKSAIATWIPGRPPAFDVSGAYLLYQALLEPAATLTDGAHLIIVASGPLAKLPLHVLVTAPPSGSGPTPWLARRNAVTNLPSVASLKALRQSGRPTAANRDYFAMANPLLDGPDARFAELAGLARRWRTCADVTPTGSTIAMRAAAIPAVAPAQVDLKSLVPLPETAEEVCTAANSIGSGTAEVRLGADATEQVVKSLNADGSLKRYKILHFATHGALPGELTASAEAGLVLTPPANATAVDDGFLSASEISEMKLDADWVILSACNTAGAARAGFEPLSGLARAFIYAGARSLLVSHWPVASDTTVRLITRTLAATGDTKISPAKALQRAMITLIDSGDPIVAHPAFWAPFIVVGERSAER